MTGDNISQSNQRWFSKHRSFSYFDNLDNQYRLNICINHFKKYSIKSVGTPFLLDIGCGDGQISELIAKSTKFKVFGVDLSSQNVTRCTKRGIACTQSNLDKKLPYKSGYFDFVFAGEVIEHLFDTNKFLKEINRVLKPGGVLIITTPNLAHFPDRLRFLFGKNPTNISPIHPFLHLHIRPFTYNMLEYALNLTGFKVESFKSTLVVFKWQNDQVHVSSRLLAILRPTFGNTMIVEAVKSKT